MASFQSMRAWTAHTRRLLRLDRVAARSWVAVFVIALGAGTATADDFTVTSTADDGSPHTLRLGDQSGEWNTGEHDRIRRRLANQTISLSSSLPLIEANVTIDGAGAPGLTISGAGTSRVFFVDQGTVSIEHLTIANGFAQGGTGGAAFSGGGGGMGAGGGTIRQSERECCAARGGVPKQSRRGRDWRCGRPQQRGDFRRRRWRTRR